MPEQLRAAEVQQHCTHRARRQKPYGKAPACVPPHLPLMPSDNADGMPWKRSGCLRNLFVLVLVLVFFVSDLESRL
jgi:hypothetical protein